MEQVNEQVKLYLTVQRFEDQFLNEIDELGNETNFRSHGFRFKYLEALDTKEPIKIGGKK